MLVGKRHHLEKAAAFRVARNDPFAGEIGEGAGVVESGHVWETRGAVTMDAVCLDHRANACE